MSPDDTRTGELPWTGERYLPEITGDIELEHLHRYAIARDLAYSKDRPAHRLRGSLRVGTARDRRRKVTGVDICEEAIAHAAREYLRPNIAFAVGSCACIPLADASVDLVVSFGTIEHHDHHLEMIQEIRRVLRPAGVLIISSPDKHEYSDVPGYKDEYHVKELFPSEFADFVSNQFRYVSVLGQRMFSASFVAPTAQEPPWHYQCPRFSASCGIAYIQSLAKDLRMLSIAYTPTSENISHTGVHK